MGLTQHKARGDDESLPSHLTLVKLLHVECPVPWYKAFQKPLFSVYGKREPLKFVLVKFCPTMCAPTTPSASCTGRCRAVRALWELSSKAQCPGSRAFHGVITNYVSICQRCIPGKYSCFTELTQPFECQAWEIVIVGDFAKCTVILSQGCYAECKA